MQYGRRVQGISNERGASLAEFALLLPIILLILLGTVDLGLGIRTYIGLANAAREGARWASIYPTDNAGTQAVVLVEAARVGLAANELATSITTATSADGDTVTVTVVHDYPALFGGITGIGTFTMQIPATMPIIYE
jgi:Flp pilus assembly protein TadG